jgi:hypothetical protein
MSCKYHPHPGHYSHVLPFMQKSASDKLEDLLFRKSGTQLAHKKEKGNLAIALTC